MVTGFMVDRSTGRLNLCDLPRDGWGEVIIAEQPEQRPSGTDGS
jgi:hypothetical protein